MKVRGQRKCQACDHRWSYYETGSVECPACGSMRSVGVDDRMRHTAAPVTLDLSSHRRAADAEGISAAAADLKSTLRRYRHKRGFIRGGELLPLDETFLAATELLHVVDVFVHARDPTDDEQFYLLDLLRGADSGERPDVESVPESMRAARGLAYAEAVDDYRRELQTWFADNPDADARQTLGRVADLVRRAKALDGNIPLEESETLVRATQEIASAVREGDETALVTAQDRLSRLL